MSIRLPHVVYAGVALAAVVLLVRSLGGPEREIERRLGALGASLERGAGEGALESANKARAFADLFVDPPLVRLDPFGQTIGDRAELMRGFLAYRAGYDTIGATFRDVETEVSPSGIDAQTDAVAVLSGSGPNNGRDAFRITLSWRQEGGEWKLREAALVEVLEGLEAYF